MGRRETPRQEKRGYEIHVNLKNKYGGQLDELQTILKKPGLYEVIQFCIEDTLERYGVTGFARKFKLKEIDDLNKELEAKNAELAEIDNNEAIKEQKYVKEIIRYGMRLVNVYIDNNKAAFPRQTQQEHIRHFNTNYPIMPIEKIVVDLQSVFDKYKASEKKFSSDDIEAEIQKIFL